MTSFMAEGGATAAEEFVGFEYESRMDGQNYTADVIYETLGADPNGYYAFMGDLLAYFWVRLQRQLHPRGTRAVYVGRVGE